MPHLRITFSIWLAFTKIFFLMSTLTKYYRALHITTFKVFKKQECQDTQAWSGSCLKNKERNLLPLHRQYIALRFHRLLLTTASSVAPPPGLEEPLQYFEDKKNVSSGPRPYFFPLPTDHNANGSGNCEGEPVASSINWWQIICWDEWAGDCTKNARRDY